MQAPEDWLTTIGFILAAAFGLIGCAAALLRLRGRGGALAIQLQAATHITITAIASIVFIYRQFAIHEGRWAPLQSHVDGLTLLISILGAGLIWTSWRAQTKSQRSTLGLQGIGLFVLPVLTVLSIWGICASWWTMREFNISSIWLVAHLLIIYLGSMAVVTAAGAGALWLWVNKLLKTKTDRAHKLNLLGSLGNLESIENAITSTATVGFALITLGLLSGLIIISDSGTQLGPGWWHAPKMILAMAVWIIYALVMHVRWAPTFRGRAAAWLSILGCVLLIMALGVAQQLPGPTPDDAPSNQTPTNPSPSGTEDASS